MRPNFNDISDRKYRDLAVKVYKTLSQTGNISIFEIEVNDILCQVALEGKTVFFLEIRKSEAEFFLFDMNFILSDRGDFQLFEKNVLTVIDSSLKGNYKIEVVRLGNTKLSSTVYFEGGLKVLLYRNLFKGLLELFPGRLTIRHHEGQSIMK